MKSKISFLALALATSGTALAQNSAKVLQVMRGDSVLATYALTPELSVVVLPAEEVIAVGEQSSYGRVAPFPEDDGAKMLSQSGVTALQNLVKKMDRNRALEMGETQITDEQFAEIKQFVDENLKGADGPTTYANIFKWVTSNLKYAWSGTAYLDPYDVFVHKTCVCQGYANLLKTMCITQGLPAFVANGQLVNVGAHAWNYVYDGKKWIVSDPTNSQEFAMTNTTAYTNKLQPSRADLDLFEDDNFCYGFEEGKLNINEVKPGVPAELAIPNSVAGYCITQFSPRNPIPETVRSLTFGKKIQSLGLYANTLRDYTPGVEEVALDPENRYMKQYNGIIYMGNSQVPFYIPPRMKRVELIAKKRIEKNTLIDLSGVEEVVFADGTEIIESYAIESCPNLKRVYVPTSVTEIQENAIYRCPADVEIITITTGIEDIRM